MSMFLGPIHQWLYNKIEVGADRASAIEEAFKTNFAGDAEALIAGEIVIYWAARLGGPPLIARLATKRWFRMDTRRMQRTEILFSRWGVRLVMFGRIFPGLRTLVSVPAGLTRMDFGLFFGAAFSGAYIWNTLLVGVGYALGFKVTLLGMSILG